MIQADTEVEAEDDYKEKWPPFSGKGPVKMSEVVGKIAEYEEALQYKGFEDELAANMVRDFAALLWAVYLK